MNEPSKIVITGEGGQGIQAIANILAKAAFKAGKLSTYLPNYGVEQRGGVSIAFVQICGCEEKDKKCDCQIGFPKFKKADILINLRERAIKRTEGYVGKNTIYVYDSSLIPKGAISHINCLKIGIPASAYATKKLNQRVFNMIILGAAMGETGILSEKTVQKTMDDFFAGKYEKKPELKHLNRRALEAGVEMIKKAKNKVGVS